MKKFIIFLLLGMLFSCKTSVYFTEGVVMDINESKQKVTVCFKAVEGPYGSCRDFDLAGFETKPVLYQTVSLKPTNKNQ